MSILPRIFAEPELRTDPPVLVDVGAAAGVHRAWRRIARYSIGIGFEPDARETAALSTAQRLFKRWIFCPAVAWPTDGPDKVPFHLTRSPQCSSGLPPQSGALNAWAFADMFTVQAVRDVPAMTLSAALAQNGVGRIDWLKCDTQGIDLQLFESLPSSIRAKVLAVEFEPGLIDAYAGEAKLGDALSAMAQAPFWLAELEVKGAVRGGPDRMRGALGRGSLPWLKRLGPLAPAWANARWFRDVNRESGGLGRREFLLAWVFAHLEGQHSEALTIAAMGGERFGSDLFDDLTAISRRRLRWGMAGRLPVAVWRRLRR